MIENHMVLPFADDDQIDYEDDQPDSFGLRAALMDVATPPEQLGVDICRRCGLIRVRNAEDLCSECYEAELEHMADAAREQV